MTAAPMRTIKIEKVTPYKNERNSDVIEQMQFENSLMKHNNGDIAEILLYIKLEKIIHQKLRQL